jgi:AcrR family transcriptional regulator
MDASPQAVRRPRGRPQVRPDEETRHLIAEVAKRIFVAKGFAGANMDDVAREAGVSKKTLYRLVPTKADLFKASVTDRIARFMLAIDSATLQALPLAEALERILTQYGVLTLSPDTVAIQKMVITESERFPDLSAAFFTEAIVATQRVLADFLADQCRRGLLDLDDPLLAAGMLRGMMIMEPQRAAMMGQAVLPSAEEIGRRARACVSLFLKGAERKEPVDAVRWSRDRNQRSSGSV